MKEKVNLPPSLFEHLPWESNVNPIWPASSFTLRRNLGKYLFPPKMTEAQSLQTLTILKTALLNSSHLSNPVCLNAEDLSALQKEYLFEHFLCMESFQNTLAGQGFVVDDRSKLIGMLNIQDHLQLHLIDCSGAWEKAWNTLNSIESALSQDLSFAFNSRFGYLSSDPSLSGTSLTVHVFLHLPALIHTSQLEDTLAKLNEEEVTSTGMQGTLDELVGDLLVLKNTYTLGVNEENILHALHSMAMKLMALEKTLRAHLQTDNHLEMKDKVCRAFGLLMHSYQLQTKEALSALSLVKLGSEIGWIGGVSQETLNKAFFTARRAHLAKQLKQDAPDEHELPRRRAEYLHKLMHGIELKIEV